MTEPFRVALDTSLSSRNQGGTGTYTFELLRALRQLGVDVTALGGWKHPRLGGVADRVVRNAIDLAWTHGGIPWACTRQRFDVLHAPAFVAPLFGRQPSVVTVFDSTFFRFPGHYKRWFRSYMRIAVPRSMRRSSAVVTLSMHSKQELVESFDVPASKVHVIYLGVDQTRFRPGHLIGDEAFRATYGFLPGYILHVGTLVERKNIPSLVHALKIIHAESDWAPQLVLAGAESGGMAGAEAIRRTIWSSGMVDKVVVLGHVRKAALPEIYRHASVLAMPSRYEGFGLPIIEAMSSGVPVVAADNSSLREIVADDGILTPTDDVRALAAALNRAGTDVQLRRDLVRRGLLRAEYFSWRRTAQQTLAVYRLVADAN